jgi:hypothetical protein
VGPDGAIKKIRIQQDGATAHIKPNDAEFNAAVNDMVGGTASIEVYTQSANSPDVNLLDLGFFRAIQSFNDGAPANEGELIENVEEAYLNYPYERINRTWLTLQTCFNEIINNHGGNIYKIPHMGKEKLQRLGQLPTTIPVTDVAFPMLLGGLEGLGWDPPQAQPH